MERKWKNYHGLFFLLFFSVLLFACREKPLNFRIGVLQWTEKIYPYRLTYQGVIDGLHDLGFQESINLKIDYRNVEQDRDLAYEVSRNFVRDGVDLIVALGTGSSLAAIQATRYEPVPIVFSIVGSPETTGIIDSFTESGSNITGVSMKVPVKEQFQRIQKILPRLKKLGILYCTEMPQAVATGMEAFRAAGRFGWAGSVKTVSRKELSFLRERVEMLAAEVDAVYIPTDSVLGTAENLDLVIRVADEHGIPVFGVAEEFVKRGVLAAYHCDYYEIGRQAASPITRIFKGVDAGNIPSQKPIIKKWSLNLRKADQLGIRIDRDLILTVDNLIN
ncbi:ABC transporter substrate-binding protein [Desulfomarina sp.]